MYMKLAEEPDVEIRQVRFREGLGVKFPWAPDPLISKDLKSFDIRTISAKIGLTSGLVELACRPHIQQLGKRGSKV